MRRPRQARPPLRHRRSGPCCPERSRAGGAGSLPERAPACRGGHGGATAGSAGDDDRAARAWPRSPSSPLDYRGQAHGVISGAKRGAHDAFAPIQHGVDALVRPVGSFLSGAVHGGGARRPRTPKLATRDRRAAATGIDDPGDAQLAAHAAAPRPAAVGGVHPHRDRAGHGSERVGLRRHRAARQGQQERRGRRHARGRRGGAGRPGHRGVVVGMHGAPRHRRRLVGRRPLRYGREPRSRPGRRGWEEAWP